MMTKLISTFIGGFIVGIVCVWGWTTYTDRAALDVAAETTSPSGIETESNVATTTEEIIGSESEAVNTVEESNSITVRNQDAGSSVTINAVTLEADGWIVVHEENGNFVGNALGAIRRDIGTYTNIEIPLLRNTVEKTKYWIVLYHDNGDRQFNLRDDFPVVDGNKNPIISSFQTL